jgi:hypothetical protein
VSSTLGVYAATTFLPDASDVSAPDCTSPRRNERDAAPVQDRCQVSGVRCQVSGVRCQVSGVRCQGAGVRFWVSGFRVQAPAFNLTPAWVLRIRDVATRIPRVLRRNMRACILAVVVFIAGLVAANCGSVEPTSPSTVSTGGVPSRSNNPVGPPTVSPSPTPSPSPSPSTGSGAGAVQVTVTPNPVPFSGQPITDLSSCANRPNTWFYNQALKETGGVAITITRRVDTFDGAAGSATSPNLRIAANGSSTIATRWCSVSSSAHTAQSSFSGTDANGKSWSVTGPLVRLLAK